MDRHFFDQDNEDYLYQSVRDKIIRDKQVDIDVNSNFRNMMSKLMNQVYQSKQDKTVDELNDICSNSINLFFVNIIDKKIKKHETKNNNQHSNIQDTKKMEDSSNNDDMFFKKLYDVLNSDEDNSELAEHFQGSGPSVSSKTQTLSTLVDKKDDNSVKKLLSNILSALNNQKSSGPKKKFLVIIDVLPTNADNTFSAWTDNDEITDIRCPLNTNLELINDCEVYLEFLSLQNTKSAPAADFCNIELCHSFVIEIDELTFDNSGIYSNNQDLGGTNKIVIPNETFGFNDNGFNEDVGGALSSGGAQGDVNPIGGAQPADPRLTSHIYKMKSNYLGKVGSDTYTTFKVSIKAQKSGTTTELTPLYAGTHARVQIGLLFKEI